MLDSSDRVPADNPEALQEQMDHVRTDMVEAIEQLKLALRVRFNVRYQLAHHPLATLATATVTAFGIALGVRRYMHTRRIRRTLWKLSSGRGRRF
jgi:hypothetical protein